EIVPLANRVERRDGESAAVASRSAAARANGRLRLTDAAGAVCGLAVHCRSENRWRGWLRGPVAPAALAAATLVERP
ncbi:MAG: hypothetical protein KDE27_08960, partial [Planctomycetes bacterium]|nr:hypothetical protein [Planctomycetota bacterium]